MNQKEAKIEALKITAILIDDFINLTGGEDDWSKEEWDKIDKELLKIRDALHDRSDRLDQKRTVPVREDNT